MAKSIRSKWKRKCRAIKRERYAVKELARLKKMLGVKEEEKPKDDEVMETEQEPQVIYFDASQIPKKNKGKKAEKKVEQEAAEEDAEMSSDEEKVNVEGENGEKRIFNTKTLKDQNGIITLFFAGSTKCIPRKELTNFKIDEFIDKLLSSAKFEQLANKIAEKAVEKINKIQHENEGFDKFKKVPLEDNSKYFSKRTGKTGELKKKYDEKSLETSSKSSLNESTEKKITTDEFNMDSIMSLDLLTPAQELSLKYKHFTKNTFNGEKYEVTGKSVITGKKIHNDKSPKIKVHSNKNFNKTKQINKIINMSSYEQLGENSNITFDTSIENAKHDNDDDLNNEDNNTTQLPANNKHKGLEDEIDARESDTTLEDKEKKEFDKNMNSKATNAKSNPNNDVDNQRIPDKNYHNMNLKENNNNNSFELDLRKTIPAIGNIETETDSDDNEEVSNDEPTAVDENKNNSMENTTTSNLIIREEGGKYFTFEKSSDYDEYHQTLTKIREQNKNI